MYVLFCAVIEIITIKYPLLLEQFIKFLSTILFYFIFLVSIITSSEGEKTDFQHHGSIVATKFRKSESLTAININFLNRNTKQQ